MNMKAFMIDASVAQARTRWRPRFVGGAAASSVGSSAASSSSDVFNAGLGLLFTHGCLQLPRADAPGRAAFALL